MIAMKLLQEFGESEEANLLKKRLLPARFRLYSFFSKMQANLTQQLPNKNSVGSTHPTHGRARSLFHTRNDSNNKF
jgi:hypothetical protein